MLQCVSVSFSVVQCIIVVACCRVWQFCRISYWRLSNVEFLFLFVKFILFAHCFPNFEIFRHAAAAREEIVMMRSGGARRRRALARRRRAPTGSDQSNQVKEGSVLKLSRGDFPSIQFEYTCVTKHGVIYTHVAIRCILLHCVAACLEYHLVHPPN